MATSNNKEFQRASAIGLSAKLSIGLRAGTSTVILDARRREAFGNKPWSIPTAVPIFMDDDPVLLPDLGRDSSILVVCQCKAQASSIRVARWLLQLGYRYVWILEGGLDAYAGARERVADIGTEEREKVERWIPAPSQSNPSALIAASSAKSSNELDRREMAVAFVDMVDFTSLLVRESPESVLTVVQSFMKCVSSVAQSHCGDIRDFEGDGAFIYFASPREALPAAFELRKRLSILRRTCPNLPLSRISIDFGQVLIGPIESERRAIAFIGTPVVTAARLLKVASPEGIIVTQQVIDFAEQHPDLGVLAFSILHRSIDLKGLPFPVEGYEAPLSA